MFGKPTNGPSNAPMLRPRALVVAGIGVGAVATATCLRARSKTDEKRRFVHDVWILDLWQETEVILQVLA
jgi:hypothetical protein